MRIPALPQPKVPKQKVSFWTGVFSMFKNFILRKRSFLSSRATKK